MPYGADDEIRTRDIQLGKLTLYHLSYIRAPGEPDRSESYMESGPRQGRPPIAALGAVNGGGSRTSCARRQRVLTTYDVLRQPPGRVPACCCQTTTS